MTSQEWFDKLILEAWRTTNWPCGKFCGFFLRRMGVEEMTDFEQALRDLRVVRRPNLEVWRYATIGTWLCAAYPSFVDAAAATEDARKVQLSSLKFNGKAVPPKRISRALGRQARAAVIEATVKGHALAMKHTGQFNKLRGH